MCLQDLRISRRLSVRTIAIAGDGSGQYFSIDLSRAAMVVIDQSAGFVRLTSATTEFGTTRLIRDRELSDMGDQYHVYTRESLGGAVNSAAWVYTEVAGVTDVVVHEYDADTMREIHGPLKG